MGSRVCVKDVKPLREVFRCVVQEWNVTMRLALTVGLVKWVECCPIKKKRG